MNHMNLTGEILKAGYENLGSDLQKLVENKMKFINSLKQKEPTKELMIRINLEEDYCNKVLAFQIASEDLIEELQTKLQESEEKANKYYKSAAFWHKDCNRQIEDNLMYSQLLIEANGKLKG